MSDHVVPHFHNDAGVSVIEIGSQEFMCVVVLEKAERLEEVGAGLQLSPNASRILIALGLQPRLAARAVVPDAVSLMSARSQPRLQSECDQDPAGVGRQ